MMAADSVFKFTSDWVGTNLNLRRKGDKPVPLDGLARIATALDRVYTTLCGNVVAANDWPLFLRLPPDTRERIRRGAVESAAPRHDEPWWADWMLPMAELVLKEVKDANPRKRVDYYGFTADGPVVRLMIEVTEKTKEITGQKPPSAEALAKKLERQRSPK